MKKLTKVLSLALATVMAVSVFTSTTFAASRADQYKRDLTVEEQQAIATIFDAKYYAEVYRDVMDYYGFDYYTSDCDVTLLAHFLTYGIWEERQPNAQFNIDVFATRNVDLHQEYGDDIIAYYLYYATYPNCMTTRGVATWSEAYNRGVTVYSVYDFVAGEVQPKAGSLPVQTVNYAPNLGIGVKK